MDKGKIQHAKDIVVKLETDWVLDGFTEQLK